MSSRRSAGGAPARSRHRLAPRLAVTLVACLGIATATTDVLAAPLMPAEKRGRQIYRTGRSDPARPITAILGGTTENMGGPEPAPHPEVAATAVTCAGCHGADGRGTVEGGLAPPSIRWSDLTKPYGHTHESRAHGPYTERSLARTIELGIDPAGNRLAAAMPTYRMAPEDLADLVAYLKVLGADPDPGVDDTVVRLGTVVPAEGPFAAPARAAAAALGAYLSGVNGEGGVYGRMLDLRVAVAHRGRGSGTAAARQLVDDEAFAVVGNFDAGTEKEIVEVLGREEVPLIAPLTVLADARASPLRSVFYLGSGLRDQARALVELAWRSRPLGPAAIVSSDDEDLASAADAALEQSRTLGWPGVTKIMYTAGRFDADRLGQRVREVGAEAVFFLGHGRDAIDLVRRSGSLGPGTTVYAIGASAGRELLEAAPSLSTPVALAYPVAPAAVTGASAAEYRELAVKHRLPGQHLVPQLTALAAGRVLVEGLKRVGRDLTRDRVIGALETLYDFDSGLSPRITFGANRRVGAIGAWIVTVDPARAAGGPASQWITPRD